MLRHCTHSTVKLTGIWDDLMTDDVVRCRSGRGRNFSKILKGKMISNIKTIALFLM